MPEFAAYYIKGHMCATGYLVGIIAGAILHDHKGSTWRLSKVCNYLQSWVGRLREIFGKCL